MIPEQRGPQEGDTVEVVRLNQKFRLFNPSSVTSFKDRFHPDFDTYESIIDLETGLFSTIPISIEAAPGTTNKLHTITPFYPEGGYIITQDDFLASSRIKKIRDNTQQLQDEISFDIAPLRLSVNFDALRAEKLGIIPKSDLDKLHKAVIRVFGTELPDELINVTRRLRFQVFFPKGSCESKADIIKIKNNTTISFNTFYPLDTGPLPVDAKWDEAKDFEVMDGLYISLPSDLTKLSTIQGRFVFAPDEEGKQDNNLSESN